MSSARGKNYTNDELKQLCNSVLHISECPLVGAGQKAERFWERVTKHYAKNKPSSGPEGRVRKSLEGKWSDIRHDTSKFIGAFKQVEDLQISGTNEEDTLHKARELYRQNHPQGKSFTFESCFWILRESPRWSAPADEMASKKASKRKAQSKSATDSDVHQSSPQTPVINLDSDQDVVQSATEAEERTPTDSHQRPIGNKRAKDDQKRQKLEQDFMKESLRVQGLMANASIARNEFNQGEGKLLKLLQIPTANLDPRVQDIVARWTLAEAALIERKLLESQPTMAPREQTREDPNMQFDPAGEDGLFDGQGEDAYVPEPHDCVPANEVYIPDTSDPNAFMAEMELQFQGQQRRE